MKKLLFMAATLLLSANLNAQPWMKGFEGKPVLLKDVIAQYERNHEGRAADNDEQEPGNDNIGEGRDYQFDRWCWYMKQHTDEQGYIVSPLKTFQEWRAYQQQHHQFAAAAKSTGTTSQWSFQGPTSTTSINNGLGRINTVAFHPTDSNTFWIGAAGGGAWKTTNNGVSWTCMTDMLPVLGASDIVFNPLNPNTIYLATGDRDASDNYSVGVLKSTNGGVSWDTTGLQWDVSQTRNANAIVINPADTNSLLLASSAGIYKSHNGGASWTNVQTGNFKQILYRPNDTNIVYSTNSNQIFRSTNGGLTWTSVAFLTNVDRVAIAVTPANPNIVKAVSSSSLTANLYGLEGIYTSSDTGHTFVKIMGDSSCTRNILGSVSVPSSTSCGGQGWYDLCIAISLTDSNKMLVGGVNTWSSSNGGKNWNIVNQAYGGAPGVVSVHPDKHFLKYQPTRPNVLFEGNDGGVYMSANQATTVWNNLSTGLGITQFYRLALSNLTTFVIGGAQDNGTKRINNGVFNSLTGGDGMNCEMDFADANVAYSASQYGSINRTLNNWGSNSNISNNIPGQPQGDWITPYLIHPNDHNTLVAGYDKVYSSADKGSSWTAISSSLSPGSNITRLALSISNPNTVYAIVANSIRRTYNYGVSWSTLATPNQGTFSDIIVDQRDNKHIWVTYSGYGTNKVAEYDTVHGWVLHNDQLPNIPVNCITIDTSNGTKYIGTDAAVFYRNDTMTTWALYSTGLPAAEIRDLGINYTTDEIWAATYGRGMWKSAKHDPNLPMGISMIPLATDVITVSPNPNNGKFTVETKNSQLAGHSVQIRITSVSGQTAWHGAGAFDGSGKLSVHAESLARGTYVVEIAGQNGMMARAKMVVF